LPEGWRGKVSVACPATGGMVKAVKIGFSDVFSEGKNAAKISFHCIYFFFFFLSLSSISLGVPVRAEIIPFEPEQDYTCGGTKMTIAGQLLYRGFHLIYPLFC
jgi:hypothetical protein